MIRTEQRTDIKVLTLGGSRVKLTLAFNIQRLNIKGKHLNIWILRCLKWACTWVNTAADHLKQGCDLYLERLLPGQLLGGGGAVLLNTIKHPGLRLEAGVKTERKDRVKRWTNNPVGRDFSLHKSVVNKSLNNLICFSWERPNILLFSKVCKEGWVALSVSKETWQAVICGALTTHPLTSLVKQQGVNWSKQTLESQW